MDDEYGLYHQTVRTLRGAHRAHDGWDALQLVARLDKWAPAGLLAREHKSRCVLRPGRIEERY